MNTYILKLVQEEQVHDLSFGLIHLDNKNEIKILHDGFYKEALSSYLTDCSRGVIDTSSSILQTGTPHAVVGVKVGNTIFASYSKRSPEDNIVYVGILGFSYKFCNEKGTNSDDRYWLKNYVTGFFRERHALMSKAVDLINRIL